MIETANRHPSKLPGMLPACLLLLFAGTQARAEQTYKVEGLVLQIDKSHQTLTVSEERIPNFMEAMVMTYRVSDSSLSQDLKPGMVVDFSLVVEKSSSYVRNINPREFDSVARDPVQVKTLKLLEKAMDPSARTEKQLATGELVPDFALTDQSNNRVTLSEFRGKLVAVTFIYTRCPLPDYCFRLSNNFGQLRKRFEQQMGRDLVLLSITFDPMHDQPAVLRKYAGIWGSDTPGWHFLTGSLDQVKQVCSLFGMNFWPDEGLLTHSLHTVLIDRQGQVVANIEGNQFTAKQLGDLVASLLAPEK